MQFAAHVKKILLMVSLLTTLVIFYRVLVHQKKSLDANEALNALLQSSDTLQLKKWNAVFYFCYYGKGATTSESCHEDQLQGEQKLELPLRQFKNPTLNFEVNNTKQSREANTVHLTYKFSQEERALIQQSNEWVLAIARNAQRATFLGGNMAGESDYGQIADTTFGITLNQLIKNEGIELIINYKTLNTFGPLDLPAALVKPSAVRSYLGLTAQQAGSAALSKQLLVGLPLVMGAVAIVLDHSPSMLMLALFGALRAVHTYIGFLAESSQLSTPELLISYFCAGASFAVLMMFLEQLFNSHWKKIRWWHRITFVLSCGIISLAGHWLDSKYSVTSSLWIDSFSAFFGIIITVFCLLKSKRTYDIKQNQQREETVLSKSLTALQTGLVILTLIVSGSVNIEELIGQLNGQSGFTDPLDWRHMMLMPALLTAGLLEVGSVAKRMLTFGQEMAEKAVFEKELKVGRDVQARMLPDKKYKNELWQWRAVYHPAEALAGDWFDIREIVFADGRKLLAVCLADVTGHGVGSSLSTSVICSHWSLWCTAVGRSSFPSDKKEREVLISSAPLKIHEGLSALRKNENCTAMMALIDPYSNEVTICSAGHPGALILNKKTLRYITSAGERLGGELMGEAKWIPKTERLEQDDLLVIYSDGIVPVGATVLSWAAQLKKRILAGEHTFEMMLMKSVHENKRVFLKDLQNEDDMTLILLKLS